MNKVNNRNVLQERARKRGQSRKTVGVIPGKLEFTYYYFAHIDIISKKSLESYSGG
jgi:hypothetical protein